MNSQQSILIMSTIVKTNWNEKMSFNVELPTGTIQLDAAKESGGQGNGLRPKALMLAALGGCTAMDVASLLKKMRVSVDDFKIDVEAELTEEHPRIYRNVLVTYHFWGENIEQEKIDKIITLSYEKYCGVMEMFKGFTKITIKTIFH